MTKPLVQMRGIVKKFPGVVANDRVDLDIYAGEIHALLGENGSGKSTIMSVLAGLYKPDAGEILIDGTPFAFASPRDAIAAGVGMVYQHFKLVEPFTVAQNLQLGERQRFVFAFRCRNPGRDPKFRKAFRTGRRSGTRRCGSYPSVKNSVWRSSACCTVAQSADFG